MEVSNDVYKFAENLSIMRNLFLQLFVLLSLGSYAATFEMDTVYYDRNGKGIANPAFAAYYRIMEKNPAEGNRLYRDYYASGELRSEGKYLVIDSLDDSKTVRDGECIDYYRDGKTSRTAFYRGGKLDDRYTEYRENGICYQLDYVNGVPKNEYYELFSDDGVYSRINIADNKPYYTSPSPARRQTEFRDGVEWSFYMNDGLNVAVNIKEVNDYGKYFRVFLNLTNNSFFPIEFDESGSSATLIDNEGYLIPLEIQNSKQYQKRINRTQFWEEIAFGALTGIDVGVTSYTSNDDPVAVELADMRADKEQKEFAQGNAAIRQAREEGYLKRTTVNPGESIEGYFNIKRKKGDCLTLNLVIAGATYQFPWTRQ